ncbi:MAG TPA: aldose epimerase [Candidatus Thermoplasmatota archaeon]|nr:aldose epimerase [Candidatus Thermoplasmatota archaeon]
MADPEWTLAAGAWRATVSPFGASLRRLWVESAAGPRDVLWGYSGTAGKRGGQGDVLLPFPGRVAQGAYTFAGQRRQLERNDKDGPNAIHGFVRNRLWAGEREGTAARFATRIAPDGQAGYPFTLDVAVGYELLPGGLACAFVARNGGDAPAPFGAGFHPYVATPGGADAVELSVPASQLVEFDGLLPTGKVVPVPPELDFRKPRRVGGLRLNHCLTGLAPEPDGFTRVRVGDVEVWMGDAFSHVVLYTGDALGPDARQGLAVEPMTCATDAFNHPEWGLRVLQPGEAVRGTWGVALRQDP